MPSLWVHDERYSMLDLILNADLGMQTGDVVEITAKRPEETPNNKRMIAAIQHQDQIIHDKLSLLEVSVSQVAKECKFNVTKSFAIQFQLVARLDVTVKKVDKDAFIASHIEVTFSEQYIGRTDMWGLKKSLVGSSVYLGKKVASLGVRGIVKSIFVNGIQDALCGIIAETTKIIFRSETAKYFVFIQMSHEMRGFDEDGDTFLEKAIDGFLPELFSRWKLSNTNHVVSIVLFARVLYLDNQTLIGDQQSSTLYKDANGRYCRDFYKVVIDWETCSDWAEQLIPLKSITRKFERDILTQKDRSGATVLCGSNSTAREGNILEAVNLALNPFDKHYVDRDLTRTGLSIVVITPGTGFFEVDYKLCRLTNQRMTDNGIGLDLVCLSKPPLHSVPLFQFVDPEIITDEDNYRCDRLSGIARGRVTTHRSANNDSGNIGTPLFMIPSWVDCSFWSRPQVEDRFVPRAKMYELQMMGKIQEFGISDNVPYLDHRFSATSQDGFLVNATSEFNAYDDQVFREDPGIDLRKEENGSSPNIFLVDRKLRRAFNSLDLDSFRLNSTNDPAEISVGKSSPIRPTLSVNENRMNSINLAPNGSYSGSESVLSTANPKNPRERQTSANINIGRYERERSESPVGSHNQRIYNYSPYKHGKVGPAPFGSFSGSERGGISYTKRQSYKQQHSLIYPCNPEKNIMRGDDSVYRWEHLYPKPTVTQQILTDWKSLCTPASLPLTTDYFPSPDQLARFYQEYTYTISTMDDSNDGPQQDAVAEAFLVELVKQRYAFFLSRLAQGFQLIVQSAFETSIPSSQFERPDFLNPYYVSLGDHVHRLFCAGNNVQVERYIRIKNYVQDDIKYPCSIWPKNALTYEPREIEFTYPPMVNYNYLDHLISGYQDQLTENLRYWRTRFLVIPIEKISNLPSTGEILSDEEERLVGFKKFIGLFEKARYESPGSRNQKIDITYSTFTLSNHIRNEQHTTLSRSMSLNTPTTEKLSTKSSPQIIIQQMHSEGLIQVRTWHFRSFESVCIGEQCVDWFISRFSDIDTREAAVEFGNSLLLQGFLVHVYAKHAFLDGFYFYKAFKKQSDGSLIAPKISAALSTPNCASSRKTIPSPKNRQFEVTRQMTLDVDPLRKSARKECAFLHYDTLHNPSHCFHFQIHWLVCTAKLIEDILTIWNRMAVGFGFRIVEAPVDQQLLHSGDPFQSFIPISISVSPPKIPPQGLTEKVCDEWYLLELARKFGFVLDVEHDSSSLSNQLKLNIVYSYQRRPYTYTQCVHRSGTAFVQLRGDSFVFVVNRVANRNIRKGVEEAERIRNELTSFCSSPDKLGQLWQSLQSNI